MISGLYAAATGMMAIEDRQSVIANNIANANTPGFKRHVAVQEGFYHVFESSLRRPGRFNTERAPGGGMRVMETFSDFSNGSLRSTGNPLDVAIVGPGFITVSTPNGERYTRNGQFSVADDGRLLVGDGHEVLGTGGGSLTVQGGDISIDGEGSIFVNGQTVGQIQLVEFDDPQFLVREGATLYAATDQAKQTLRPAEQTTIVGGSLESANVQIPVEVSDMLLALRAYSANQKAITAIDETLNRLIDQVGAPN